MFHRLTHKTALIPPDSPLRTNQLLSALGEGVVHYENGRARITLTEDCRTLIEEAETFGHVLSIGRNPWAVLGRMGAYPEVKMAACRHCARSTDNSMAINFAHWQRGYVTVEPQTTGWLYAATFENASGGILHKICLTPQSDFEAFRDWVLTHHEASEPHPLPSYRRRCEPEPLFDAADVGALHYHSEAIPVIFQAMTSRGMEARTLVNNEGFILGSCLRPTGLTESGGWLFASGHDQGLQLRMERMAEVTLHRISPPGGEETSLLRLSTAEGAVACTLAPPDYDAVPEWETMLSETLTPYAITDQES